jgi:hypothetical protein
LLLAGFVRDLSSFMRDLIPALRLFGSGHLAVRRFDLDDIFVGVLQISAEAPLHVSVA